MGFALDTGYIPKTFAEIMSEIRVAVNAQFGTTYTAETFVGTNFYKYAYAIAQRIQAGEIKTSEIFLKVQNYFLETNAEIANPAVTTPGIIDRLKVAGYAAAAAPLSPETAGTSSICVDVDDAADDYADKRLEICTIIKNSLAQGIVSQGTESETITLSNGQSFDYKFFLPERIPIKLKLTLTLSRNNQSVIQSPDLTKQALLDNIARLYSIGKDFEPKRYFTPADAPWASDILLEYSEDDGSSYEDAVRETAFDELLVPNIDDIDIIES